MRLNSKKSTPRRRRVTVYHDQEVINKSQVQEYEWYLNRYLLAREYIARLLQWIDSSLWWEERAKKRHIASSSPRCCARHRRPSPPS